MGLSLVVAQSAIAFTLVKVLGAAYLVYLGVRMLMREQADEAAPSVSPQGARRAQMEGIVVEALNVKTALFFLAVLPQFVASSTPIPGSACLSANAI